MDAVSEVEDVEATSLREVMRLRFGCFIVEEISSERTSFLSTWADWLDFSFGAGFEERILCCAFMLTFNFRFDFGRDDCW